MTTPQKKLFKYRCECCDFNTDKTSTFKDHNKSTKHLKNMNNKNNENIVMEVSSNKSVEFQEPNNETCSMISVASNESYMTIKIRELENTIKLKDAELKMKDTELKMKDEQIELLKNTINILSQNRLKEEPNIEPTKKETKNKKQQHRIKRDDLPKNALTIEEFFKELIKDADETRYTQIINVLHQHMPVLKPEYFKSGMFNMLRACMNIARDQLELCKELSPIVCINKLKKKFWVNTKSHGWISSNKNKEEVNNALLQLYSSIITYLENSFFKFKGRLKCSESGQYDIQTILEKKRNNIELDDYDKKNYQDYLITKDRQNIFKQYTNMEWNDFEHIHSQYIMAKMNCDKEFINKSFKYFKSGLTFSTDVETLIKQYDKAKNNDKESDSESDTENEYESDE